MATKISTAARNAACNAVVDLIDAGSSGGHIEIRSGTQPADPGTAATGTLLATIPLNDPAFGNASSGVATAGTSPALTDSSADASGTATWFRVFDSNNVAILDGAVGATGSGADMELSNTSIGAGQSVTITSWTVTMPGS